jgi:hypothetical protein
MTTVGEYILSNLTSKLSVCPPPLTFALRWSWVMISTWPEPTTAPIRGAAALGASSKPLIREPRRREPRLGPELQPSAPGVQLACNARRPRASGPPTDMHMPCPVTSWNPPLARPKSSPIQAAYRRHPLASAGRDADESETFV